VMRYVPEYAAKKRERELGRVIDASLFISLAAGVAGGALLFLLAPFIAAHVFHDGRVAPVIEIFAFAIPFYNAGGVALAACRAFKRIDYEVLAKYFVENGLKLLFAAAAVLVGAGFLRVTAAFAAAIIASSFLAFFLLRRITPAHPFALPRQETSGHLLHYSIPLMLSSVVWLAVSWADTFFVGAFRSVGEVGVYNAALPTAAMLTLAPVALSIAFKPITVEMVSEGRLAGFKRVYSSLTKWIFVANLPLLVFFVFFPSEVMRVLFGSAYVSAGVPLAILSVGFFVSSLLNLGADVAGAFDRTKLVLRNAAAAAAASLALNFLLVPHFGIVGAAVATAAALALYGVLSFLAARRLLKGIRLFSGASVKVLLSAVAAAVLAWLFSSLNLASGTAWLAAVGAVFGLLYASLVLVTKCLDEDDLLVLAAVKRRLRASLASVRLRTG